jgi:hypothetical protein
MSRRAIVSVTATVPAESDARSLAINTGTPVPATAPTAPSQQAPATPLPDLPVLRYAAAVLKGQPDMLESVAACFDGDDARILKHEEGWILESPAFASCVDGAQVFPIADDLLSRIHQVLSLYCDATETLSVEHVYWINAEGKKLRALRGFLPVNVISSKGLAELKTKRGSQPLGSAVMQAMSDDAAVKEGLTLHGADGLSWSQIYDIIEFLGGEAGIAQAGYAIAKETRIVRQTANHYRHLGSPKKYPLPSNPPLLADSSEFASKLLRRFISGRLAGTTASARHK